MCKFCSKHADKLMPKSKWYFNPECYSEELGKSKKRAKIFNKIIGHSLEYYFRFTNNMLRYNKYPILSSVIKHIGNYMAPRLHAGQIVTLQDALKVIDLSTDHIALPCYCRRYIGGYEENACLSFGVVRGLFEEADPDENMDILSPKKAKRLLQEWDEKGYYHQVLWAKQPYIITICNCDARSCIARKQRINFNASFAMFKGHEVALVNLEKCNGCGICKTRCHFNAISINKKAQITFTKCFGCGLCAITCPQKAITMIERSNTSANNYW